METYGFFVTSLSNVPPPIERDLAAEGLTAAELVMTYAMHFTREVAGAVRLVRGAGSADAGSY